MPNDDGEIIDVRPSTESIEDWPYTLKTLVLDKNSVSYMKRMEHYRPIRPRIVTKYRKILESGGSFIGVFIINRTRDGRNRTGYRLTIIDGNHRWESIAQHIENNPECRVNIDAKIYENLSETQQELIFIKANEGIKVKSSDEFIVRQKHSLIWKLIKEDFPCKVRTHERGKGILLSSICIGYTERKKEGLGGGD